MAGTTRVTKNSSTLIDVILTKNPGLFKKCGVFNPEISDHHMIYGLMGEKVIANTWTQNGFTSV